ncbi:MAG TPA: ZIP family metal transporter [Candidatus Moranbacteria bacterium]|nr:ZIP family metal transporter [Candidatus Moranbacteria bacterium]HAT75015.1 ZIP family metal transporter [Candidatus Moranbacteria bacterium]
MIWLYTLISVSIVSLISLVGVFALSFDRDKLYKYLIYFVSLSAGTLMGDAFIHLIPEAYENSDNSMSVSIYIILGILVFFVLEKIIHWRHCHKEPCVNHPHPFSYIIIFGDSLHNFIDGMIIGASYLASIPLGIATTIAVVFHEIPQEIGDFASLIYGGFSRKKALVLNFLSALAAAFGAFLILIFNLKVDGLEEFLIPFAAGGFIYIAGTDLIPELHKSNETKNGVLQVIAFIIGIGLMLGMLVFE